MAEGPEITQEINHFPIISISIMYAFMYLRLLGLLDTRKVKVYMH